MSLCTFLFQNERFKKTNYSGGRASGVLQHLQNSIFIKLYIWLAYRNLNLLVSHTRTRPKVLDECKTDQTGNDTSRAGCEHNNSRSTGTEADVNKIIIKKGSKGATEWYALKAEKTDYPEAMARSRWNFQYVTGKPLPSDNN